MTETHYLYRSGDAALAPLLLLHSTGGDETELLPLAGMLAPERPLLSIRGRVSENGYNRYFERYAEGSFNLESLATETEWLTGAMTELAKKFEMDVSQLIVIGYSNGANMALHMALTGAIKPQAIVAHHAMQLTEVPVEAGSLSQTRIFLTHGKSDPIVPEATFAPLEANLKAAGAPVEVYTEPGGHQLSRTEIAAAGRWLEKG